MKFTYLLCLFAFALPLARSASPDEELKVLQEEYERKQAAAVRPINDWYAAELAKREKAYLAAGKSEAAAVMARAGAIMLVCSTTWSWNEANGNKFKVVFKPDMTGHYTYRNTPFKWSIEAWTMTLTSSAGRQTKLKFDPKALTFEGYEFGGKVKVKGAPLAD
jgi:hypothetical protein